MTLQVISCPFISFHFILCHFIYCWARSSLIDTNCSTLDTSWCYVFFVKAPFQMMVLLSFTASTKQGTSFLQLIRMTSTADARLIKTQINQPRSREIWISWMAESVDRMTIRSLLSNFKAYFRHTTLKRLPQQRDHMHISTLPEHSPQWTWGRNPSPWSHLGYLSPCWHLQKAWKWMKMSRE